MEIFEIIKWVVAVGAGGVITFVSQLLFFKPNKRIKDAEADAKEIDNLNSRMASMENQIDFLSKRLDVVMKDLGASTERERTLQNDLSISELKRQKGKNAISQAHGCKYVECIGDCPVLARQKKLEDEYLASLVSANERQTENRIKKQ